MRRPIPIYRDVGYTAIPSRRPTCWLLVCVAAMVMVAVASPVALAGSETGSVVSPQREAIVGEWRAAYLPHGWIASPRTTEQITEAVRELGGMKMNTQIHNIGVMDATGSVPAEMHSGLSVWVDVSRQVEPEQQVVLWVSGDTAIHVKDRSLHGSVGAWLASLVESADADGVLLDFEPFRSDDPDLVPLLETIRAQLPHTWIGLTAPPDDRWSGDYLAELSSRVEAVSPLLYDTGLSDAPSYRNRVATQVARYQKAAGASALVVPSLPSYSATSWHDPSVENIEEAVRALATLNLSLDGAAVYWWWEFTEESRQSWLRGATQALVDAQDGVGTVDQTSGLWTLSTPDGSTSKFFFGNPGDVPFMGDWDCDGIDTPGLYRQADGFVYLRASNTQGTADIRFFFGNPGDLPLAGDFDGDGCDTVSIYRSSDASWHIINDLGANDGGLGVADFSFMFGDVGDVPLVGDWDNDGIDTVGLHRFSSGFVYIRNSNSQGGANQSWFYGENGDQAFTGDYNGDGVDSIGLFRPANTTIYLRNLLSDGAAQIQFQLGTSESRPVAGRFD